MMTVATNDEVFASPEQLSQQLAGLSSDDKHNQIIDQIDETLGLIAEANEIGQGRLAVDHYDVSVVVPVYNEVETLPQVLKRIEQVMPPATEVIVVDDGSTDGTRQWLESLPEKAGRTILTRRANHGKGSAVRLAIRHSSGRVVAIQDADLEYEPADLLRVIWPILDGDAEVVYGSRYLGDVTDHSIFHRLGNWALTKASNLMTGLELTDMETCHKAFDGDMIRSIQLRECRFGFEPEITAKVAARGAIVMEVPTGYDSRGYDEGKKIGWRDGVAALACMWLYRSRFWRSAS